MVNMHLCICGIVLISTYVFATEKNAACVTPYGEIATCISILSCPGLINTLLSKNDTAIDFAVQCQCGYDVEPLVCCRFVDYPPGTFDKFANPHTTTPFLQAQIDKNYFVDDFSEHDLPEVKECGRDELTNKILSNGLTDLNEFPWLVALEYKNRFTGRDAGIRCGGSIINKKFILTAAQCVSDKQFYVANVWLGDWKLPTDPDCEKLSQTDKVRKVKVEEVIPHPYYSIRSANNDIALIKLANKIKYTGYIQPICLPPPRIPVPTIQTPLVTAGWHTKSRSMSDAKLKETLKMVPNYKCEKAYQSRIIGPNQMCAARKLEQIFYQGDPGGPLMRSYKDYVHQKTRWYQEGVGSWDSECDPPKEPLVYTRVSRYIRWITNIIKKDRDENSY